MAQLYVTLGEGPQARNGSPILITRDRRVVGAVLREITRMGERENKKLEQQSTPPSLRVTEGVSTDSLP